MTSAWGKSGTGGKDSNSRQEALASQSVAVAVKPQVPFWTKLWNDICTQARWRTKFTTFWVQRGLGIIQPTPLYPEKLVEGFTFVLPGIEAESVYTYSMCDGLLAGGVRGAIKVFNWGMPFPGGYLGNLCHFSRNRRRAQDLAAEIRAYQDQFPGQPVNVVAHSGGVGIAVWAVEHLSPDRPIHALVLLNGALSPTYDLSRALARTQRGILNSYSPRDVLVLDWGTRIFGTTDRKFVRGCGCAGFTRPPEADATLYQKFHQFCWKPEMSHTAHLGGHITSCTENFVEHYIAPWLVADREPLG